MFCSVLRWPPAAQPRQLGNRDVDRSGVSARDGAVAAVGGSIKSGGNTGGCAGDGGAV